MAIEDHFSDECVLIKRTLDNRNRVTEVTETLKCRAQKTDSLLRDANGTDVTADWKIFLSAGADINIGDNIKITLVNGSAFGTDKEYKIESVEPVHGGSREHIEVLVV